MIVSEELKVKFVEQGVEPYELVIVNEHDVENLSLGEKAELLKIFLRLKKKVQYSKRVIEEILRTPGLNISSELREKTENLFKVTVYNK